MEDQMRSFHAAARGHLQELDEINLQIDEYIHDIQRSAEWLNALEPMSTNMRNAAYIDQRGRLRRRYGFAVISIAVNICATAGLWLLATGAFP